MKLMICGNVFGEFDLLKKEADFIEADYILICGNVGIKSEDTFLDYWEENLIISQPIYFVTGKYEDFSLVKEVEDKSSELKVNKITAVGASRRASLFDPLLGSKTTVISEANQESVIISGVSGTFSEKYYDLDSVPPRHMTRKSLHACSKDSDVIIMHNVPGRLGKQTGLNFDMEFFQFVEEKSPKYVFVGGYGFDHYSFFPVGKTTVLFLSPLRRGYAIVDTKDWSCYFNNRMRK
jgi:hypothetical protein